MRLLLRALAFLLCASCAAQVGGAVDEPAADGAGGGRTASDVGDSDLGVALDDLSDKELAECEAGCIEFHHAPCDKMKKQCWAKPEAADAYWEDYLASCYWAIHLACGDVVQVHLCFKECNGE
jgi:hypothetical protein